MTELAACLVSADCAVAVFYVAEVHTIIYICKVVHISHNPSVVAVVFVKDFSSVDTVLQIRIRPLFHESEYASDSRLSVGSIYSARVGALVDFNVKA